MANLEAWGEAGKKYVIHDETLSYFAKLSALGFKTYEESSPEELRAAALRRSELYAGYVSFSGSETEFVVPCEGNDAGVVPVSVYKPAEVTRVPAIWIYYHGGGLVTGSRNCYAPMLKMLASRARCVVVSVEYRLAPENRAPAAFDDCRAVASWVLHNKTLLGGHVDSQVGIGGDSAGGQLTSSVSHDVKGLAFQILVYPVTDLSMAAPSYAEFDSTPGLNANGMKWFCQHFLVDEEQKKDPVICPCLRPHFRELPPALCIFAELDPLRDDGLAYMKKLQEAGVSAESLMVKGAPHVFFHLFGHFKKLTKEPYDRVVNFLKRFQTD